MEACVRLLTLLLAAVLAPLAGLTAASAAAAMLAHQQQGWHRTSAVLTADASFVATGAMAETGQTEAPVRWSAPDRSVHTAVTQVQPGTRAGTATTAWIDANGRLRHPPMSPGDMTVLADLGGACAATGVCLLAAGTRRVIVRVELERHRARVWEREWAEVEPRWTRGHA